MNNESTSTEASLVDPVFLKELRVQMLRFAILQLNDDSAAEDAVQEALVGALKNAKSFERRSALKTWVFAILKNKITDVLRKRQRLINTTQLSEDDEVDGYFNRRGIWVSKERPANWLSPSETVKNEHFWKVFDVCLNGLPENQARLFMMREFLELESDEICETLEITTSNLHVMLYRARLRLRKCLEKSWFLNEERDSYEL